MWSLYVQIHVIPVCLVYVLNPCGQCHLYTWSHWADPVGPTNIGAPANLCMLFTACFFNGLTQILFEYIKYMFNFIDHLQF
jgi:hypothetical protein